MYCVSAFYTVWLKLWTIFSSFLAGSLSFLSQLALFLAHTTPVCVAHTHTSFLPFLSAAPVFGCVFLSLSRERQKKQKHSSPLDGWTKFAPRARESLAVPLSGTHTRGPRSLERERVECPRREFKTGLDECTTTNQTLASPFSASKEKSQPRVYKR